MGTEFIAPKDNDTFFEFKPALDIRDTHVIEKKSPDEAVIQTVPHDTMSVFRGCRGDEFAQNDFFGQVPKLVHRSPLEGKNRLIFLTRFSVNPSPPTKE